MKKIYISGPISGLPLETVYNNFTNAEVNLLEKGYKVVNPFNNGLPTTATWEEHMRADLKLLLDCDAIYMLEGWEKSRGARIEYALAVDLKMVVIDGNIKELKLDKGLFINKFREGFIVIENEGEYKGGTRFDYNQVFSNRNKIYLNQVLRSIYPDSGFGYDVFSRYTSSVIPCNGEDIGLIVTSNVLEKGKIAIPLYEAWLLVHSIDYSVSIKFNISNI